VLFVVVAVWWGLRFITTAKILYIILFCFFFKCFPLGRKFVVVVVAVVVVAVVVVAVVVVAVWCCACGGGASNLQRATRAKDTSALTLLSALATSP
jgi:hypothetical protein